jgi:protein-arginine kinase activator protein McsA
MDVCPLSGKPCSQKKVTKVTELKDDGSVVELSLCKECTPKYMNMDPETVKPVEPAPLAPAPAVEPDPPVPTLLGAILGLLMSKAIQQKKIEVTPKIEAKPPCPGCGFTLKDIAMTGKLGCGECYHHFDTEMKVVLMHSHAGGTEHTGKRPPTRAKVEDPNEDINERIKSYKLKMAKAVEIENYEAAGELKKKISELQQQLVKPVEEPSETPPTPPSSGDQ